MVRISNKLSLIKPTLNFYLKGVWQHLQEKDVFLWGQAIAFKVLVTIVPVIILGTGLLGQVLRRDRPFDAVSQFIRDFMPVYESGQLIGFLEQFQRASSALTIIGATALFLTTMTLFSTLRAVLSNVFREEWHEHRSIIRGYAFDMRMVVQVGLFFILTIGLSILMRTLNVAGTEFIQQIGLDYVWLQAGWRRVFKFFGLVLPFLLSTAMFFQLIYLNPRPHPPARSAWLGAIVAAVLWEIAKNALTFYAVRVGSFAGVGIAAGTFGLVIALVFWTYYSGIVFIIGAFVTMLHETRCRQEAPDTNLPLHEITLEPGSHVANPTSSQISEQRRR